MSNMIFKKWAADVITWSATWCLRLLMLSPCINLKSLFGCNKQKSELFFLIFLLWSRSTACNNFKALWSCHICLGGRYINDFQFFIISELFDHYQSASFALKVGMISSSQNLWEKHLCLEVYILQIKKLWFFTVEFLLPEK